MLYGEIFALLTALLWTITALFFESAAKRIGSLSVNIIRLFLAILMLGSYTLVTKGFFIPLGVHPTALALLAISGLIGFTLGDMFLFEAFVQIGSRVTMLIMALVPPITAILSLIILGEKMEIPHIAGMCVTMSGIAIVVLDRGENKRVSLKHPLAGILLALGGALGQASGLILSKKAMSLYQNAFAATQIRCIAGFAGLALLYLFIGKWKKVFTALKDRRGIAYSTAGAFFGPFLGVTFSLLAVYYTEAGVAATLMAIVPVLIIPPSVILYNEKIDMKEIVGTVITVCGVAMMFIF